MAPELCKISGSISHLDGVVSTETQVIVSIDSKEEDQGGQLASGVGITSKQIEVFTDGNGRFEVSLIRGASVLLEIPNINLRKIIVVPATETAEFSELI